MQTVACPHCGRAHSVVTHPWRQEFPCRGCGRTFTVDPAGTPAKEPAGPSSPISFTCPTCAAKINAPGLAAGRGARCPRCGEAVCVPAPLARAEPPPAPPPPPPPRVEPVEVLHAQRPLAEAQHQPGPWEVRVSARILHWPTWCACCMAAADRKLTAHCVRFTGIEVVRAQVRGWDVPYCDRCARHVELYDAAAAKRRELDRHTDPWPFVVIGVTLLALFFALIWHVFADTRPTIPATAVVTVLMVATVGIAAVAGVVVVRQYHRFRSDGEGYVRDALARVEALAGPHCRRRTQAVEYVAWDGTVHAFLFHNLVYAEAFAAANASKVLR